jgi:acetyl-CoA acetyltransferase
MALLLAGLPVEVGGLTVNRLCGSGLQAINSAAHAIQVGDGDVFIGGGVESMTRAPYVMAQARGAYERGSASSRTRPSAGASSTRAGRALRPESMGETGENVADRWHRGPRAPGRVRPGQPAQGRRRDRGRPVRRPDRADGGSGQRRGAGRLVARDEHPRADTTAEALARLKPAFRDGGTVTAGNSSGINDGASAVLLAEADRAPRLGLTPMARIVSTAVAGVDPAVMGIGPVPASRKALERAGIGVADLDLVELNEAFASQSLACIDELGLDPAGST